MEPRAAVEGAPMLRVLEKDFSPARVLTTTVVPVCVISRVGLAAAIRAAGPSGTPGGEGKVVVDGIRWRIFFI